MYSAVRKMFNQHSSKDDTQPLTMTAITENIKHAIGTKADKQVVETLVDAKANKVDTEMCLRWVDLLHKMVNKIMLLMTCKLKSDIEVVGGESQNMKQNRKV